MYIVKIINESVETTIHGKTEKLISGNVVKGINCIDSFSFSMLPSNKGFNLINDYKTLVTVYNTNKDRYEFYGRVLYSYTDMAESGLITKEVTCESYLGFLCDSKQKYVAEKNWTVSGLLSYIVNVHNSQVETHKRFAIGQVNVTDPNNNLYVGIQRENSWKTIEDKLINQLGGEIRFRVANGVIYLDYLQQIGTSKTTAIQLSHNMKSITKECDPSNFISRLIPLGCKLKDAEGNETEERLDIKSVNNGIDYIEDEAAKKTYGIRVEYVEFDDVETPSNLLIKGRKYLSENNKVQIKYSVKSLDLSLLGLDIDDFEVGNYHPLKNALIEINDTARIHKKNIDVCNDVESGIELGDNFKTLSDLQREQALNYEAALKNAEDAKIIVNTLKNDVKTLKETTDEQTQAISSILQTGGKVYVVNSDGSGTLTTAITEREWAAKYVDLKGNEISGLYFDFANKQFKFIGSGKFTGDIESSNAIINGGKITLLSANNTTPMVTVNSTVGNNMKTLAGGFVATSADGKKQATLQVDNDGIGFDLIEGETSLSYGHGTLSINGEDYTNITGYVSNANGQYYKFPDGTLICTKSKNFSRSFTEEWGSMYETTSAMDMEDWAHPFISIPKVVISSTGEKDCFLSTLHDTSETVIGAINACRPTYDTNLTLKLTAIGIGRWK